MSGSSEKVWSNNPNAPQIPYDLHFEEKTSLAGAVLGAIFYGIAIILFFQCMGALLNPADRKTRGIKWGLMAHTAAMFSALTINAAISLDLESISYVDNREFPGNEVFPPGPSGDEYLTYRIAISTISIVMSIVSPCLADGFLLYRCYVIYSRNFWVIVLPCLMYLAFLALSIVLTCYQISTADPSIWNSILLRLGVPSYSISLSLNIILTLMIATRLIRHRKNIRNAMGPTPDGGLYNTVVTILVESCALYAVFSLLYLGSIGASNSIGNVFAAIFANIQVIGPFLIVLRVANRTALTNNVVSPVNIGSIRFKSRRESTGGSGAPPHDEDFTNSMEIDEEASGDPGAGLEDIIEEVPL